MLFTITSAVLSLLFFVTVVNLDQGGSPSKDACALIDKNRPPQFIVYEGKSESDISLRLRNNSSCAIVVETDDTYPTQLKKLPQGGATIETVFDARDGQRLPLHYLVQKHANDARRAYSWGDSVFTYEIPSGQSIIFEVPTSHFKQRSHIVVPFGYAWEGNNSIAMGIGGVVHRVYFLFEDLPAGALR
jgi:hypothetical protein